MDDIFRMGCRQRFRDLRSIEQGLFHRERALFEPLRQSDSLHQFHHQLIVAYVVQRADMRMIQR